MPIGLLDDREYDEVELAGEPGDALVFYSDGVDEQLNEKGEEFGRERIMRVLKKHGAEPPQAIADAIIAAVDAFRGAVADLRRSNRSGAAGAVHESLP